MMKPLIVIDRLTPLTVTHARTHLGEGCKPIVPGNAVHLRLPQDGFIPRRRTVVEGPPRLTLLYTLRSILSSMNAIKQVLVILLLVSRDKHVAVHEHRCRKGLLQMEEDAGHEPLGIQQRWEPFLLKRQVLYYKHVCLSVEEGRKR